MPYRKTGFVKVSRAQYIPLYCAELLTYFGGTFDADVAECIKSLGKETIFLKNFFFERVLMLKHPKLDGTPGIRTKFMIVLADFLNMVGYIPESPSYIDYVTDPVMDADMLLDLMLGTRMPVYKSSDLGGEFANIDTLQCFFPEVIRRNALILNERRVMAERYRLWLGNIGFKLMTGAGALSQSERSFMLVHGCTKVGSKGHISVIPSTKIPPKENKDNLVNEVGALAQASVLGGPSTAHFKLISNTILEQLLFYYGPHIPDLKSYIGFKRTYGPFTAFIMDPEESIPWQLDSQISGISAQAANMTVRPNNQPPFTLRVPLPIMYVNHDKSSPLYPDPMDINLYLTDQTDISRYTWDYMSSWRGRRIHSLNDGGTMDFYLCDAAVKTKTAGGMQVEATDLSAVGICWLSENAQEKVNDNPDTLFEQYVLPSESGLRYKTVDMAAYYARFGVTELLPAYSEWLSLPLSWFIQPADRAVDFICATQNLTLQERVRFSPIIAICHNCARYKRLTKKEAPIDRDQLILSMLNSQTLKINPEV